MGKRISILVDTDIFIDYFKFIPRGLPRTFGRESLKTVGFQVELRSGTREIMALCLSDPLSHRISGEVPQSLVG